MGMLDKDAYEGKRAYAERKMLKNAEVNTLTEEQHDVLSWLCYIRHNVHCNQEALWNSEAGDHSEYWGYITDFCGGGEIMERLKEAGLAPVKWSFNPEDYMTEGECFEFGYGEEEREEEHSRTMDMAAKFNNDIEKYLAEIDKNHGTEYCPSGSTRIY